MRLCPWSLALASSIPVLGLERVCPRKGCPWPWPWPRIFFVSLALALASSLVSSTPPLLTRSSLFLPRNSPFDCLYVKFQTLKLKDMIKFEFAKFIFKFKNNMHPLSFSNYFVDLNKIHKRNTRQKSAGGIIIIHSTVSLVGKDYITHV